MTHRRRKLAGFMTIIMFYIFSMIRKVNESFEPRIFFQGFIQLLKDIIIITDGIVIFIDNIAFAAIMFPFFRITVRIGTMTPHEMNDNQSIFFIRQNWQSLYQSIIVIVRPDIMCPCPFIEPDLMNGCTGDFSYWRIPGPIFPLIAKPKSIVSSSLGDFNERIGLFQRNIIVLILFTERICQDRHSMSVI